jgi:hypothetical protein
LSVIRCLYILINENCYASPKALFFAAARAHRGCKMWQRLPVLALCGMSALWADVCGGLPTGGSGDRFLESTPSTLAFRISVRPGGPAFRITVGAFLHELADRPIHAGDIEVARCQDGKRLQLLPILSDQPLNFGASFHAEDINFDGYLDFSIVTDPEVCAGCVASRSYWVYDPGSGLFVQNELTSGLGGLEVSDIDFDPKKHEVSTTAAVCASCGCPGMQGGEVDRYRVENNRLILIHKQDPVRTTNQDGAFLFCTVTESDVIGGTMHVTSVRRFDINGRPLTAAAAEALRKQPQHK